MIFFTSDTHFGHKAIIDFCKRPYSSVEEMNEELVKNWNNTVSKGDTVYHLGDFAFHNHNIFHKLNGKKHLIKGNHDDKKVLELPWSSVQDYKVLQENRKKFVLFHCPITDWEDMYKGSIHLHGHVHSKARAWQMLANSYDVGVDANNYTPVSMAEILSWQILR